MERLRPPMALGTATVVKSPAAGLPSCSTSQWHGSLRPWLTEHSPSMPPCNPGPICALWGPHNSAPTPQHFLGCVQPAVLVDTLARKVGAGAVHARSAACLEAPTRGGARLGLAATASAWPAAVSGGGHRQPRYQSHTPGCGTHPWVSAQQPAPHSIRGPAGMDAPLIAASPCDRCAQGSPAAAPADPHTHHRHQRARGAGAGRGGGVHHGRDDQRHSPCAPDGTRPPSSHAPRAHQVRHRPRAEDSEEPPGVGPPAATREVLFGGRHSAVGSGPPLGTRGWVA